MVEWKKLGEVCDILNGFAFKSQHYVPQGIRVIRISDVQSGYISEKDMVYYPLEKLPEYERYRLKKGDIVMSLTGNPGRIAIIPDNNCALNQRVACLRSKNVYISFIYYLFNCKEFENIAFANSTGGAQKNMSTTWLKSFTIPIPSLAEQHRIVEQLDTFTSAIDNLKEQIAQRRKQYEHYRDQLLDLEGKEGVEMKSIGDLFIFKNGLNKEKKYFGQGNPIVNYTDVYHNKKITKELLKGRVELSDGEIDRFRVHKGDVFFTRTSETKEEIGFAAVMTEEIDDCTFSGFLLRARPTTLLLLPEYCAYCFGSYKVRQEIIKSSTLTTRALTNGGVLSKISIPVPSLSEQQRIVSILDTFESSIQNLEAQLEQRQKQYEYYRNKLLTFE